MMAEHEKVEVEKRGQTYENGTYRGRLCLLNRRGFGRKAA